MGSEQEGAVKAFIAECEGNWDSTQIDRILGHMTIDAKYHVYAWEDPHVGHDAIRGELLRQAPSMRPFRCEIVTIGSVGDVVFTERLDSLVFDGKSMNGDRKIATWRGYLDRREVEAKAGPGVSSAGTRG
jgi:limonene-1,2-epoxide hydrolase